MMTSRSELFQKLNQSQKVYEAAQHYRHAPIREQGAVTMAYQQLLVEILDVIFGAKERLTRGDS